MPGGLGRICGRRSAVAALGLLLAALALYTGALGNAPVSDDFDLIVNNPFLKRASGVVDLVARDLWGASRTRSSTEYYRPVSMLTFWAQAVVGGVGSAWLRSGNVILHALAAILLRAALLQRLPRRFSCAATLFALLWVALPLHSEGPLWLSARFDLCAGVFALGALVAARRSGSLGHAIVLSCVISGLLSKESFGAVVPLLVLDETLAGRRLRELVLRYGLVALAVAVYLLVRTRLGVSSGGVYANAGLESLFTGYFSLVALFARLLVWPDALDMMHRYTPLSSGAVVAVALAFAGLAAGSLWLTWRRRAARDAVLVGVAWAALTLAPSAISGAAFGLVGDRYAYLPAVGVFLWAAGIVSALLPRLGPNAARIAAAVLGLLTLAGGVVTVRRSAEWRDEVTLARAALARDPDHHYWMYVIAKGAAERNDIATAEPLLMRAAELAPGEWRYQNALCFLRIQQERLAEALHHCSLSLEAHAGNPTTCTNIATIHVRQRDWQRALEAARRASELRDGYVEALYLRAVSAANLSHFDEASESVRAGLAEEPEHPRLRTLERQLRARGVLR